MTATVRSSESFSLRMICPSFGASCDFLYPRALCHCLSDLSSVSCFLMYKHFPGHFSNLNMLYCVHSRCTVFLDVIVFLGLLGSCILCCPSIDCAIRGVFSLCDLRIILFNFLDYCACICSSSYFIVVALCTFCNCIFHGILSKIGLVLSSVCPLYTILRLYLFQMHTSLVG